MLGLSGNLMWKEPLGGEGFFERLIQSTKRCLKKMAGRKKLQYEELLTLLVEIEAILNCRPLSYVSSKDLEEPLTPSHLMFGRRPPEHLVSLPQDDEDYTTKPEIRVRFLSLLLNHFWKRWKRSISLSSGIFII